MSRVIVVDQDLAWRVRLQNAGRLREPPVEYTDLDGERCELDADEMLARVIQHENDHLDGVLIVDHAKKEEREKLQARMDELEEALHA